MINGNFLRRIELHPSWDLGSRRDLLYFQTTCSLEPIEWEKLVIPPTASAKVEFHANHREYTDQYRRRIRSYDPDHLFNFKLSPECVNTEIYNLCLINRIRYDMNYPLIDFEEEDWIDYMIFRYDPQLQYRFDFFIREHMVNE